MKARIKVFWTLRQMILQLTEDYNLSNSLMKVNPLLVKNEVMENWEEGQTVQISEKDPLEKILCNIRTNQKMEIRHVLADQDYFLLVELKLLPNTK